jgi:hypothetical protein
MVVNSLNNNGILKFNELYNRQKIDKTIWHTKRHKENKLRIAN